MVSFALAYAVHQFTQLSFAALEYNQASEYFSKITLNYPSSSLLLNFMASEMMAAYAEIVEFHSIIVIK